MTQRDDLAFGATEGALAPFDGLESGKDNSEEAGVDWGRFVDALRRRKWWVVGVAAAVSLVAFAVTLRQPKLYLASVSLVIETSTPRVLTGVEEVVDVGTSGWVPDSFYETEYEIMKSRAVARAAGNKVRILDDDARTGLTAVADVAEKATRKAQLDAADFTLGRYAIEPDKRSSVVRISVVDEVPAFTAKLANAVADAYVEQNLEKRIMGTRDASSWLSVQNGELKRKLEASEDALYGFMEQNDVLNASLESQLAEVLQRVQAFNVQLAQEEATAIRERKAAEALERVREDPAIIQSLQAVQTAPVIHTIKTSLEELKSERERLATRYQPEHPKMDENAKQITRLEQRLKEEIDAVLMLERRKQEQLNLSITGLREKLTQERQREARLNKLSLEYQRLKREVDTNEKLYGMVTTRMKEADITSALPFNNVRVLDRALVPVAPFKPNLQKNVLIGLLLGIILGVALVIIVDLADNTVKSQEDIEQRLSAPFLGLLPLIASQGNLGAKSDSVALKDRDLYTFNEPKSAAAECARFIRTNLLFMSPDRPLRSLVVTSPAPQEGKTTTCVSLAVAMAQSGSRTLIVDTDLRRPRLHRVFGVASDVGLSSVIVGEATLEQAIHKTIVGNLDVLVCGPLPPNPAEILHTERFKELLKDLRQRYDRVLFDSPPLGPVTDPAVIAAQVDGVVLVVKCEKTTRDMAAQSLRALRDAKARLLGVILNDVDVSAQRYSRVYYSYYRRYGTYYGDGAGPDAAPREDAA